MSAPSTLLQALNKAAEHLNAGRHGDAEPLCRKVLKARPKEPNALRMLGMIRLRQGKPGAAEKLIRKAIRFGPESPQAYMELGLVMTAQGKQGPATQALRRAVKLDDTFTDAWFNLGLVLQQADKFKEAIAALEKSVELRPDHARAFGTLGHLHAMSGQKELAAQAYRRGLDAQPDRSDFFWNLANLKEVVLQDDDIRRMEDALENGSVDVDGEVYLCFSLAKAFEDREDYDRAFEYLSRGNSAKHKTLSLDFSANLEMSRRVIETIDTDLLARLTGGGDPWEAPIFILSLPRSGSTLVEQILASHSQVTGGDELPHTAVLVKTLASRDGGFPGCLPQMTRKQLRNLADQHYVKKTRHLTATTPYFTDKTLNNFQLAGFLHLLLPRAKFVHVRRNPMDTCLSNYRQLFVQGQEFSYDLRQLGRHYQLHDRLMAHWHALMPGRIHEVCYEDLVADQAAVTRELLQFLGLPWEDNCLRYYKTDRTVRTVSSAQVRQPMSGAAVERWRKYEKHLRPLAEALQEPLE